ncbi:discoidin domain-containing protein [Bacillus solitudinis]|uniref:discoidin domain-containing protein n=1 Tax=Bacillus solitudinis TaxID=2014074 RepID=UPI000C23FE7A|nr:discoidin domain-containing protein [Bacillus solitudinis]
MSDKFKGIKSGLDHHVFSKHSLDDSKKKQMVEAVKQHTMNKKRKSFFKSFVPLSSAVALVAILFISSLAYFNQEISYQSQEIAKTNIWVSNITSSSNETGYGPENTMDGNPNTVWSGTAAEEWIEYDFGFTHVFYGLRIIWKEVYENSLHTKIEVSNDRKIWTEVWEGAISETDFEGESYLFLPTETRYLRLTTFQDEENGPISISSIEPLHSKIEPIKLTASSYQDENTPENTIDGDFLTRWSANGENQWIAYELEKEHTIEQVAIAWYEGDVRKSSFQIEMSTDGSEWNTVYVGESSGNTTSFETYEIEPTSANYLRIVNFGNTVNDWNSITQTMIR